MLPSDKPADAIIEDDEKLDRWFEQYVRDIARASGKNKPGNSQFTLDMGDDRPTPQPIFVESQQP